MRSGLLPLQHGERVGGWRVCPHLVQPLAPLQVLLLVFAEQGQMIELEGLICLRWVREVFVSCVVFRAVCYFSCVVLFALPSWLHGESELARNGGTWLGAAQVVGRFELAVKRHWMGPLNWWRASIIRPGIACPLVSVLGHADRRQNLAHVLGRVGAGLRFGRFGSGAG